MTVCFLLRRMELGMPEEDYKEIVLAIKENSISFCSELVINSYRRSFFSDGKRKMTISTARAGNVIGGGDFADYRIIPDCISNVGSDDKDCVQTSRLVELFAKNWGEIVRWHVQKKSHFMKLIF